MAYVPKTKDEEEAQSQGAPKTVPGTEAGGLLQQATPTDEGKSPNKSGMSGFTDVGAYLDANREQGQQLGEQIAGNVEKVAKGAQGAVDQTAGEFQNAVSAGTMRPDQGLIESAATDPMGFLRDPGKATSFKNTAIGVYNGPANFEELPSFASAKTKTDEAKRVLGLSSTASGRRELISALEKNPTAGQMAFDEMIFGLNPEAVGKVSTAAQRFGNLDDYIAGKKGETTSFANQAAADRAAARQMILDRFGTERNNIKGAVQSNVAAKRAALENMIAGYKNGGFADYQWTPEELAALGISESDLADINRGAGTLRGDYGDVINPGGYFNQSYIPGEVTEMNQITPDQIAKYEALQQLIGMPNDYINERERASATPVPTQLGTLDRNALQSVIGQTLGTRDQALIDGITTELVASTNDKKSKFPFAFPSQKSGYDADGIYRTSLTGEQLRALAAKQVKDFFTANGLTPPNLTKDSSFTQADYNNYWNAFKNQYVPQRIAAFGKSGILNRTKYDPIASYDQGRSAFASGGGYGIY